MYLALSIFMTFLIIAFIFQKINYLPYIDESSIAKRYYFIDGIRGLAAICVVVGHSWRIGAKWINTSGYSIDMAGFVGAVGVQVFFCITGFLFIDQVIKRKAVFEWKRYFLARIKRLFPMFFVATTICILIIYSEALYNSASFTFQDIKNTIKLYTFGFYGNGEVSIGGVDSALLTVMHWTLPFEWKFYFSLPIICFICIIFRIKSSILFFLIVMLATYFANGLYLGKLFLTGCVAAIIFNKYTLDNKMLKTIIFIIGVSFFVSLFFINVNSHDYTNFTFVSIFFLSIILSKPKFLGSRALVYIGESSYSIYLIHTIIMFLLPFVIYLLFGRLEVKSTMEAVFLFSLVSAFICSISLFSFKNIEYPFIRKDRVQIKNK